MSNLVIVAIPRADDRVWKVSSEKVPHLTLLHLGEAESNPNVFGIMEFVQHAIDVSEHGEFMLSVDYRDTLGDDNADVVFFDKDYSFKWVEQFRAQLLQNESIRRAHESSDQFMRTSEDAPDQYAEWRPHLTLGYPNAPAKDDDEAEHGVHWVSFDRIAVWTGDYDGPSWRLKWPEIRADYDSYDGRWSGMAGSAATSVAEKPSLEEVVKNSLTHVSEKAWSDFTKADYTPEQWHAACLIHLHDGEPTSKNECKLPVKTPDGALNRNGVHAAAAALAGARGGVDAPEEEKTKAAGALRRYYKQLEEDPPESLAQTTDLVTDVLEHYGKKGMKWGVRKEDRPAETRREGIQRYLDPQGHDLPSDVFKTSVGFLVPVIAPLTWPAQIRLMRGGVRGVSAKAVDREEKRFTEQAQSQKNFVEIHNRSGARFNREIVAINKKHPDDLTKDPAKQKAYDDDVKKLMQDSYREAAKSIGNKNRTMHLDVEFRNDGLDFVIQAKQGRRKPLPKRVQHADEDEIDGAITLTGKIKRDATGHIIGFEFDNPTSMAQTINLGAEFLEHYGVKGMKWGQRRSPPTPVAPRARSVVPHGAKRKTKIKAEGGENQEASEDAIRVAEAHAKLKKSGTAALSNKELQDVQTRLNLERNVKQLVGAKTAIGRGRGFVKGLTGFNRELNESVNTGLNSLRIRDQLAR